MPEYLRFGKEFGRSGLDPGEAVPGSQVSVSNVPKPW